MIYELNPHKIVCGDLTQGAVATTMGTDLADVIYSDPPWGPGLHTMFHTAAKETPKTDWAGFLEAFAKVCKQYSKPSAPIFVEMGTKWVPDLDSAMDNVGLIIVDQWNITY